MQYFVLAVSDNVLGQCAQWPMDGSKSSSAIGNIVHIDKKLSPREEDSSWLFNTKWPALKAYLQHYTD